MHHFTPLKGQRHGHLFIIFKDVLAGVSFYSSHRFVSWGVFSKIGQMTHLWLYCQICVSGCIFPLFSKMRQKLHLFICFKNVSAGKYLKDAPDGANFWCSQRCASWCILSLLHGCPSWCIFSLLSKLRQLAQPFTYLKDAAAGASFHYFQK